MVLTRLTPPWLEAQLREEWRVRKEDALMSPTGGLGGFISVAGSLTNHLIHSLDSKPAGSGNLTAIYAWCFCGADIGGAG